MGSVGFINIPQQEPTGCDARQVSAKAWECVPCALAWDDGDDPPDCSKLTYARLIDTAIGEALRLEGSQNAQVAAGFRQYRDHDALRRAMELRRLAELAAKFKEGQR